MPSKKQKVQTTQPLSKTFTGCSEEEIQKSAFDLASQLQIGDRVLLDGPMGAGKTTFARALLAGLKVNQPPEGSPTFSIANEYNCPVGGVVHIDFYRLKSEDEIDEAGIPSYYWERKLIVISEWLSSWPELEAQVCRSGQVWKIKLEYHENEGLRNLSVTQLEKSV